MTNISFSFSMALVWDQSPSMPSIWNLENNYVGKFMKASIETYHKEVPRIHGYHWGHQCFWFLCNRSLETYTCHICGKYMIGGKNYHKLKIKYHTKHVQMELKKKEATYPV